MSIAADTNEHNRDPNFTEPHQDGKASTQLVRLPETTSVRRDSDPIQVPNTSLRQRVHSKQLSDFILRPCPEDQDASRDRQRFFRGFRVSFQRRPRQNQCPSREQWFVVGQMGADILHSSGQLPGPVRDLD